jgi:hypothetical protein
MLLPRLHVATEVVVRVVRPRLAVQRTNSDPQWTISFPEQAEQTLPGLTNWRQGNSCNETQGIQEQKGDMRQLSK